MTFYKIKGHGLDTKKRRDSAHLRKTGQGEDHYYGDPKLRGIKCGKCGSKMEYGYEDNLGDDVYFCTNFGCVCHKDHQGSLTQELGKLLKVQQMNSNLYYRTYNGSYY